MSKRTFRMLINSFLSVTVNNYKLANTLATFTDNALNNAKADAAILALYNYFHPLFITFQTNYNNWKTAANTAIGSTANVDQLLAQLTDKVNLWDAQCLVVYKVKSDAGYKALFPHAHKPFNSGVTKDEIDAVKMLSQGLTGITALAATKTDVDAFYALLIAAFNNKQGQKSTVGNDSNAVENQRIIICNALFYVYGGLVQKFAADPKQIANFMDVENMQRHLQTQFVNNKLKPLAIYTVFERTLQPTDNIMVINTGTTGLNFYWAAHSGDTPTGTFVTMAAGEEKTITAGAFGDVANNHFFTAQNTSSNLMGSFEVNLV